MAKRYEVREIYNGSLTDHLLFYRGIKTEKDRQDFLNPSYDNHTHDPFLLKDCEKAVDRILKAINIVIMIQMVFQQEFVCMIHLKK